MNDLRKIFRTAAYKIPRDGEDHVVFWSIDPAWQEPDKFYVRETDLYAKGSMSRPVTGNLPEKEALGIIHEIDRDAAKKYRLADESYKDHKWIGSNYRDAALLSEHPSRHAEQREKAMENLRGHKRPKLRP